MKFPNPFERKPKTPDDSAEDTAWIKREFGTNNIKEVEKILKNRVAKNELIEETIQE